MRQAILFWNVDSDTHFLVEKYVKWEGRLMRTADRRIRGLLPHFSRNLIHSTQPHSTKERKKEIPGFKKLVFWGQLRIQIWVHEQERPQHKAGMGNSWAYLPLLVELVASAHRVREFWGVILVVTRHSATQNVEDEPLRHQKGGSSTTADWGVSNSHSHSGEQSWRKGCPLQGQALTLCCPHHK